MILTEAKKNNGRFLLHTTVKYPIGTKLTSNDMLFEIDGRRTAPHIKNQIFTCKLINAELPILYSIYGRQESLAGKDNETRTHPRL
jgi:hypothetical protein